MEKRGKQEEVFKTHVATPEFYKYYGDKHFREIKEGNVRGKLHKDSPYYVDSATYSRIVDIFNKEVRRIIIEESFDFRMPARLGRIGIRKRKVSPYINSKGDYVNPLPVDWKATHELWEDNPEAKEEKKLVRHRNKHSGGYIAQWTFMKRSANFKNKSAYSFKATRTAKQLLGEIMLSFDEHSIDYQLK